MIFDEKNMSNRSLTLMNSLWDMQRQFMNSVKHTAAYSNLSIPQYAVLMRMSHSEMMTQKRIGEKTHLPKSTLSQAVEGLVKSGILERQHVEGDRREVQLLLTESGKKLIDKIHTQHDGIHQLFHEAVETLTDKQFSELINAHQHIINYFEKQGSDKTC